MKQVFKSLLKKQTQLKSPFFKSSFARIHNKRDHELNKSKNDDNYWLTDKDSNHRVTVKSGSYQFSKNPILNNFGELERGEIPEPLKYVKDFKMTTLPNGIRVCTESWECPIAAVGVYVDAGSRFETQDTCGTSHFLEHILFKGTKNRSKDAFEKEIENSGATLDAYTSREHTLFHMTCFKNGVKGCVDVLSDMILNPLLSEESIIEEKNTIQSELEHSNKDPQEIILEAAHFNCYRDHMIGSPILGDIDNIYNINKQMIEEYYHTNYIGKNLIIIATGGVDHEQFVTQVSEKFGNLNTNSPSGLVKPNENQPFFTPSCMFMRDDELYNASVGVFFDAPSWSHEDYYSFLLLERILGTYQMDRNGVAHLNSCNKQYSTFEAWLGGMPDIQKGLGIYSPYKDCGLFGTYIHGNEVFTRQMTYTGLAIPPSFGVFLNKVEVYRARARLYHELLNIQSPADVLQFIGPQIQYLGRRVHRSEIAKRISNIDEKSLKKVAREWLFDAEPSVVGYGPVEAIAALSSYKYFKANTFINTNNLTHPLSY